MPTKILCEDGWKDLKEYIMCETCDHLYPEIWMAPKQLWEKVTGRTDGSGLMCMACFDELARERGIFLHWTCELLQYKEL